MKKILIILLFLNIHSVALSSVKKNLVQNLLETENLSFNFEQNINGKIETGNCILEYPKKIFCKYDRSNNKILVSNGNSLVIKTHNGNYYRYSIEKTPLNFILDKKFLINKINTLNERIIDNKFVNFTIIENESEINIFFDIKNSNLIGWQTLDIYQNLNITFLSSLKKNQPIKKNTFKLPSPN
tara:strand:+ start:258 stop:809 length:552 start_codon:yes stop_codon:yes gene_type:complete